MASSLADLSPTSLHVWKDGSLKVSGFQGSGPLMAASFEGFSPKVAIRLEG